MEKIKTLTVGGESYQITDPEAARIDDGAMEESTTWSGKHIIERLCPAFLRTGELVCCYPVAGYPLTVEAPDAAVITRCGKNLWDLKPSDSNPIETVNFTSSGGETATKKGYCIVLPAGTYTFHAELIGEAGGYIYGAVNASDGSYKEKVNIVTSSKVEAVTVTLEEGDVVYLYNGVGNDTNATAKLFAERYNVQVEAGSTPTAFEVYRRDTFAPGETILARQGVNTLWPDAGIITVSGRTDIAGINAELECRLAALEAANINM